MSNRLGARIHGYVFSDPGQFEEHFRRVNPEAPVTFEEVDGWADVISRLRAEVRPNDLAVVLSARRGAVSWVPALERLPGLLSSLLPESFIIMYPPDVLPSTSRHQFSDDSVTPAPLVPQRVSFDPPVSGYEEMIREMLSTHFSSDPGLLKEIHRKVVNNCGPASEVRAGVVVPHARLENLPTSMLFLGLSRHGVEFPGANAPAQLFFILLTRENRPDEHLNQLAAVARVVSDPNRLRRMLEAQDTQDLLNGAAGV
jgi:mannitol/fructose-specific phosphotransferase system IIA component (Ntr-type)